MSYPTSRAYLAASLIYQPTADANPAACLVVAVYGSGQRADIIVYETALVFGSWQLNQRAVFGVPAYHLFVPGHDQYDEKGNLRSYSQETLAAWKLAEGT